MAHTVSCKNCQQNFVIEDENLVFYDTVSPVFNGKKYAVPTPTHCPDCRLQRRIAWRNERFLYHQSCARCKKNIVTVYGPQSKFPLYCNQCWWGDSWDARSYGRDFDFSRPFFDQLKELIDSVPQLTMQNDDGVGSQNSQYCQDTAYLKNCYLVIGTWYTEDSFYSSINSSYNRSICDCANISRSELSYECLDSQSLYNCIFLQNSENCSDCWFGFDLKGCKNCIGCIGLRQKEYYIFNQPYSADEYKKKFAEFNLGSYEAFEKLKKEYTDWILKFPRKNMNLHNCENCEGNDLFNSKETCGFSLLSADHCKFCHQGDINMFSYDIFSSGRPNWCYEGMTPDDSYMALFSWFSWKNKYLLYTINCHSSEYLFGCVSLHRAKYCILNKQYTKEEYDELVPRIIEHMRKDQQWGEFPDTRISFFPYNETVAQEYFPMNKEDVLAKGWKWKDEGVKEQQRQNYALPDHIAEVKDDLCTAVLVCGSCGKNYKIIPQELDFYRKMAVSIPRQCSICRHSARIGRRPPYKLWQRECEKCAQQIKTVYAPDRPEIVYCEKCYLETVY